MFSQALQSLSNLVQISMSTKYALTTALRNFINLSFTSISLATAFHFRERDTRAGCPGNSAGFRIGE